MSDTTSTKPNVLFVICDQLRADHLGLIRESNEHLYLFSSDYPHVEGGCDPLARFEASLQEFDDHVLDHF